MSQEADHQHGMEAARPGEIPWSGWKQIALRIKDKLGADHIQVVAAGIAFYFFLALFPLVAAALSLYGLVMDPAQVESQLAQLTVVLPAQAQQTMAAILGNLADKSEQTLGWSLVVSVVFSLWGAKKGVNALFEGLNIAYNQNDQRGFLLRIAMTLLFTLAGIVAGFIAMGLVIVFPALGGWLGLPEQLRVVIGWLRWPVLAVLVMLALALVYKFAPHRNAARFRWVSPGAVVATLLWLVASLLFSLYVNNFGNFDKTYGSFASIIILLLWFFITAYVVLLGAEINAEMEYQTRRDTTTGDERPMGSRGAFYADHVVSNERG